MRMHVNSMLNNIRAPVSQRITPPHTSVKSKSPQRKTSNPFEYDHPDLEIPFALRQYLITSNTPNDTSIDAHETRDRRFRLLLRCFTNQIQYGCKNPRCETPTCWSYRKRFSQVPLRPYNDLTARALAWHCLEDYANRENRHRHPHERGTTSKESDKRGEKSTQSDGLCRNEPVIPWYQEPRASTRGATVKTQKQSHAHAEQHSGHNTSSGKDEAGNIDFGSGSTCYEERLASDSLSTRRLSRGHGRNDGYAEPKKQDRAAIRHDTETAGSPRSDRCGATVPSAQIQAEGQHSTAQRGSKKDHASFIQSFFDTSAAKQFDCEAANKSPISQGEENPGWHSESANNSQTELNVRHIDSASYIHHHQYRGSILTFKFLPTSALIWLRHTLSRPPQETSPYTAVTVQNKERYEQTARFAKQSLSYCLSHPLRLLDSAGSWRFNESHRDVKRVISDAQALELLRDVVQQVVNEEQSSPPSNSHQVQKFRHAVQAFALLAKIRPYAETLIHLNTALQHAYALPDSIKSSKVISGNQDGRQRVNGALKSDTPALHQFEIEDSPQDVCFLKDEQVADLCMIVLLAFVRCDRRLEMSPLSMWDERTVSTSYTNYLLCRDFGSVFPHSQLFHIFPKSTDRNWRAKYKGILQHADANDNPHFLRLLETFADVISHRLALHETLANAKSATSHAKRSHTVVDRIVNILTTYTEVSYDSTTNQMASFLLELMSLLLLKKWDRNAIVQRTSPVGGALQVMAGLYRSRTQFAIPAAEFRYNFIADAFDCSKMPLEWLTFHPNNKQLHILSFSFLFDPATLVTYFRAINIETMRKSHQYASLTQYHVQQSLHHQQNIPVYGAVGLLARLRPHMALYFVLTASRSNTLEDAIDQIWRRERQELLRPLKVTLGKDEGEDGLDHGGVQQEFFRLVFAECLRADYGMFTVDERTRMTWFQPGSLEPLYKFEAVGILMSLAVYNAVTLPVTFPLAFYRKLLGLKVKRLEHVEDGWPELVRGLRVLRDWEDGDVGDVIARTYEFSYEVFGERVSVDMTRHKHHDFLPATSSLKMKERERERERVKTTTFETHRRDLSTPPSEDEQHDLGTSSRRLSFLVVPSKDIVRSSTPVSILSGSNNHVAIEPSLPSNTNDIPPSPSASEAPLVTNANRQRYIKDYITHLTTTSVSPQFSAFARGFFTCLSPTALSIFTPESLKLVIEGHTTIDIDGLRAAATYDDYVPTDQVILDFWSVVRDFSPTQHRQLLEFVTASERVPVNGITSVVFLIQRNGVGDERLPSSATCYGRLLLPCYSSREILREKLEKAIENCMGFGSL